MALSLKPQHLTRYKDIASLLLKHGRSDGLRNFDPDVAVPPDDDSVDDDARRLVDDLEGMGPTFVKLGQLLSTRADLLPPAYLDALSRLQDDVEPVGFEVIEETVTAELGARMSNAFQSFESQPRASASLGQVHRAVLRDGRPVAVKVQRPGIRQRVIDDMEVIQELAEFLDSHTGVGRAYGFQGMVEEFRRSIMAELDYRLEAANLRLLGSQLSGYQRIVVPQPIDDYTTSIVLTMDLVDGRNVGSLGPLAHLETDRCALAKDLFDAYLDQILVHGFVHADPHPGNVLLTSDGRLALIDLGMVVRITPELQDELVQLLLALDEGHGLEVAGILAGLGEKRENWDRGRFERAISVLVQQNQAVTVGQLQAGRMVGELARIAGECGLRPPVELTMLGKTLLNLDQVAQKIDPDFDPNAAIEEHVGSIMRRKMLQSASPANILSAAMEAKEFAEKLPGRVNKVMDALAEGQMTLNIQGIDERELMRGIQKLANRVTSGLIIAALIIGAAMLMQIDTEAKLFGYPSVAIVCFLAAAAAGVWLIATSLLHDLPQRRHRRRSTPE
ncbi:MAG: ubiquinone biosynthesis protein [Actinomycetota bacterium]|jgi:predicted unusual protein kinase regulating ubiquinone biosynthesis (AarF/ABC1/UbiB family)|nr:ubiquinone biosynthesis protein [Actinomycetota bacterium]